MVNSSVTSHPYEEIKALFIKNGLILPPIPIKLLNKFTKIDEWWYSTILDESSDYNPYNFGQYVERLTKSIPSNFVLIAHSGHGVNSYALQYCLVLRPLIVHIQIAYGGIYGNRDEEKAYANKCFALCNDLLDEFDPRPNSYDWKAIPIIGNNFDINYVTYPPFSLPGHQLLPVDGLMQSESIPFALSNTISFLKANRKKPLL